MEPGNNRGLGQCFWGRLHGFSVLPIVVGWRRFASRNLVNPQERYDPVTMYPTGNRYWNEPVALYPYHIPFQFNYTKRNIQNAID
jgi:hypothetical protein